MTGEEYTSLQSTIVLLIRLQREHFELYRAAMINSLQAEAYRQFNSYIEGGDDDLY